MGQRIVSNRVNKTGFVFKYPDIVHALEEVLLIKYVHHLGKKVRCFRFQCSQYLSHFPEPVFRFFSNPHNLEKITPPFLNFRVVSQSTIHIENGTIFNYKLKIRGFQIRWCSLITNWNPMKSFVDTQLTGPYRVWHHTHRFSDYLSGTLIEDEIYYALPNIPFINILFVWYVSDDINKISQFRKKEIPTIFKKKC